MFMVPFGRNHRFTGRCEILRELKKYLSMQESKDFSHCVALYGLGGIGKTQTALEYVYQNRMEYNRIFWINGVNQVSLLADYLELAKAAKIEIDFQPTIVETAKLVLRWLEHEESWLLVIDNLDDPKVVDRLLPTTGPHRHILITTRNPNCADIPAKGIEIPLLNLEEALHLLYSISDVTVSTERQEAQLVCKKLGLLPLAIEQAAIYVRVVVKSFQTFLEQYEQNQKNLHQWVPTSNREYPLIVGTTWLMSIEAVQRHHPQAVELLRFFSFLNPDGILISFFTDGAEALDREIADMATNQFKLTEALTELEKFSLIKWDRLRKLVTMHQLVQAVIRDQLAEPDLVYFRGSITSLCDRSFPCEWNNRTRAKCRAYFGQVLGPLLGFSTQTIEAASVMERVGNFLRFDGRFSDSASLLQKATEVRSSIYGEDDPTVLTCMNNLASTYRLQGRHSEASELEETVLQKMMGIGSDHQDILRTMSNLAMIYLQQGRLNEACDLQEQVLESTNLIWGSNHLETLTSMSNLALTYGEQGRFEKACDLLEQVFDKTRAVLGDNHPDTLTSMSNLASSYKDQGRFTEACDLQEQVVEKTSLVLGHDHPNTLTCMSNLASTYVELGHFEEACKLQENVLEKRVEILGEDHPAVLISMSNLASTYMEVGHRDEACALQENVLNKRMRILGDDHPDTLTSMDILTSIFHQKREFESACVLGKRVLEKKKLLLGKDHPATLITMHNLAMIYLDKGEIEDAERCLKHVVHLQQKSLGEHHPVTLTSAANLGIVYEKLGQNKEAEQLQAEVLYARIRKLGITHPDTLTSMNNLAKIYLETGQLAQAKEIYGQVLRSQKEILGEEHPDTLNSMKSLVAIYLGEGRIDEACPLQEELLEKRKRALCNDPLETLELVVTLISTYKWQGQDVKSKKLLEEFFGEGNGILRCDNLEKLVRMNEPNIISVQPLGSNAYASVFSVKSHFRA